MGLIEKMSKVVKDKVGIEERDKRETVAWQEVWKAVERSAQGRELMKRGRELTERLARFQELPEIDLERGLAEWFASGDKESFNRVLHEYYDDPKTGITDDESEKRAEQNVDREIHRSYKEINFFAERWVRIEPTNTEMIEGLSGLLKYEQDGLLMNALIRQSYKGVASDKIKSIIEEGIASLGPGYKAEMKQGYKIVKLVLPHLHELPALQKAVGGLMKLTHMRRNDVIDAIAAIEADQGHFAEAIEACELVKAGMITCPILSAVINSPDLNTLEKPEEKPGKEGPFRGPATIETDPRLQVMHEIAKNIKTASTSYKASVAAAYVVLGAHSEANAIIQEVEGEVQDMNPFNSEFICTIAELGGDATPSVAQYEGGEHDPKKAQEARTDSFRAGSVMMAKARMLLQRLSSEQAYEFYRHARETGDSERAIELINWIDVDELLKAGMISQMDMLIINRGKNVNQLQEMNERANIADAHKNKMRVGLEEQKNPEDEDDKKKVEEIRRKME